MTEELHGWRRYAVVFLGMLLTAALCALAIPFSMNPRGAAGPTALQAESAVPVVSAIIVCFGLATGIAGYVGRLINGAVGLFVLGVGLSVLAWRWETIEELAFSEGSLGLVGLETALWAGILFTATVGVLKMRNSPFWWLSFSRYGERVRESTKILNPSGRGRRRADRRVQADHP